ncbi:MAG: hypothetical protein P4M09_12295 [Devosia sp.]|nr:hypothetical protein [Devosia sp.]
MFKLATRIAAAALAATMLMAALPAAANESDISTAAFTNHAVPLYDSPYQYHGVRGVLPGGLALRVDQCAVLWCQVHGRFGHGWVGLYDLSFGRGPNSIWWPAALRHGPVHS